MTPLEQVSFSFDGKGLAQSFELASAALEIFAKTLQRESSFFSQFKISTIRFPEPFRLSAMSILSNGDIEYLKDYERRLHEEERMREFYPGGMTQKQYNDEVRRMRDQLDSLEERMRRFTGQSDPKPKEEPEPVKLNRHERRREAALQRQLKTRSRGK